MPPRRRAAPGSIRRLEVSGESYQCARIGRRDLLAGLGGGAGDLVDQSPVLPVRIMKMEARRTKIKDLYIRKPVPYQRRRLRCHRSPGLQGQETLMRLDATTRKAIDIGRQHADQILKHRKQAMRKRAMALQAKGLAMD